jgi:hypothetical protein
MPLRRNETTRRPAPLPPDHTHHPSGIWALFYIMDAVAVTAALKRFPDDKAAAVRFFCRGR